MCANLITPHSSSQGRINKLKSVYHKLQASFGRDPPGNMDGNNGGGGREYVSASGTEGSSRGSEDDDLLGQHVLLSKPSSRTCAARNSTV